MKRRCAVPGCASRPRDLLRVYLTDSYSNGDHYHGPDEKAPFLCEFHAALNEATKTAGIYAFSRGAMRGITLYKRRGESVRPPLLDGVPRCSIEGCTLPTPWKGGPCLEHRLYLRIDPSTFTPLQPNDLQND